MSTAATPRSLNPDVEDGRGRVFISTIKRTPEVEAHVLRPFCVHEAWAKHQGRYVVSHLATGRRFYGFYGHEQAMGFASELRDLLDAGGFEDSADPEEAVRRIVDIVPKDELKDLAKRYGGLR